AAVADRAGELVQVAGQRGQDLVDQLARARQTAREVAESGHVAAQGLTRVGQQTGGRLGQVAKPRDGLADRLTLLGQARHEALDRRQQVLHLWRAVVDRRQHAIEVVDGAADDLVLLRQRRGQGRGVRQETAYRAALALEHADDLVRQLVHLLRLEGPQQRLEAVEQHRQVQGGLCALDRDGSARFERRGLGHVGAQRQVSLADEVPVLRSEERRVGRGWRRRRAGGERQTERR